MKFLYFFAMGLTVVANVAYHFCQKAISRTQIRWFHYSSLT